METQKKQIVLIVDDSLLICEQIKAALKDTPIFICEAHNGQEAVDMVENYQPDLILLDVVLPDADGYSLFDKLKKADKNDAVIIFLTSKDKDEDVVKGFSMGACDYIKKPFVRGELQSRVNAHLMIKYQKDELNRQNQELRTNMEKLNYMAFRDGLTGLYNRRYVVGDLADDIRGHEKQEKKNVLILADIDDFKKITIPMAMMPGIWLWYVLRTFWRETAASIRWSAGGGEEFLTFMFDVTEEGSFPNQ